MALPRRLAASPDRDFHVYVIRHGVTPIWVGMGAGRRYEIWRHCGSAEPPAKRDYICKHFDDLTSEIVLAGLTWTMRVFSQYWKNAGRSSEPRLDQWLRTAWTAASHSHWPIRFSR